MKNKLVTNPGRIVELAYQGKSVAINGRPRPVPAAWVQNYPLILVSNLIKAKYIYEYIPKHKAQNKKVF